MQIIYTDETGKWRGATEIFDLDLSYGVDENDYRLTFALEDARALEREGLKSGSYLFVPGTEWGGIVDRKAVDYSGKYPTVSYEGRTWHGILAGSIIKPDPGATHLTLSGDCNEIIRQIIERQGLQEIFEVEEPAGVETTYKFHRYIDAYKGLRLMLQSAGRRLKITRREGSACSISSEPVRVFDNGIDNNFLKLKIEKDERPINHLICLGEGQGASRVVIDLYADDAGKVSTAQTFFGKDERAEVYDYNNANREELTEKGTEKLEEYQEKSEVDIRVNDNTGMAIGDIIVARSTDIPVTTRTRVSQLIIKAGNGKPPTISYEPGADDVEYYE